MFEIWCITERSRCGEAFLPRLKAAADALPDRILLREKDLPPTAYRELAGEVLAICREAGVPCSLHRYARAAFLLGCTDLHLPLSDLRILPEGLRSAFSLIGTGCHSLEEAEEAIALGADYLIAGHIFATGCKPGLPPRGTSFLKEVCQRSSVPVYAIGGIGPQQIPALMEAGAAGACLMSRFWTEDPEDLMRRLRNAVREHEKEGRP